MVNRKQGLRFITRKGPIVRKKQSKDKQQDKEIKQLKNRMNFLEEGTDVKMNIQKFVQAPNNKTAFYSPDKKLYYFPTTTVEENVAYAPQVEKVDARKKDKIILLRTKVHVKLTQLRPGTKYRLFMFMVEDTQLDLDGTANMTPKAGLFLRHAGYKTNPGVLINSDIPEMILNSPLNYEDLHKFKVLHDKVYIAGANTAGNEALNTDNRYNALVKYHTININHKKKDKNKVGLKLEFTDGQGVANKNRIHFCIYTNQEPGTGNVQISGYSEQYFKDVE